MDESHLVLFLSVVPALAVVLSASLICGRIALFIGQPRVVGEIVAGVLLGSSHLRCAGFLALSGIVPAFGLGVAVAWFLVGMLSFPQVDQLKFSLFMGLALSVTAFPVLARILHERRIANSRLGSITLTAACMDDAVAWSLLALVMAMLQGKNLVTGLYTVGGGVLFAVVALLGVRPLLRRVGQMIEADGGLSHGGLTLVLILLLGAMWIMDSIGIHSVFGAYIMGLAVPRTPVFQKDLRLRLMDIVEALMVPIFFAYSGLNTRLTGLTSTAMLVPFLVLLAAATLGKYGGCALAMRAMGWSWRESSAAGGLMNARGLMELILANIGLVYGVISQDVFSLLVLMAVVTTAAATPIYRLSLPRRYEEKVKASARGATPQEPWVPLPK